MPKLEPDQEDPLELVGVSLPVDGEGAVVEMAECIAEEFLAMGHSPKVVLSMLIDCRYRAAALAVGALGEARVRALVDDVLARRAEWARARALAAMGGIKESRDVQGA